MNKYGVCGRYPFASALFLNQFPWHDIEAWQQTVHYAGVIQKVGQEAAMVMLSNCTDLSCSIACGAAAVATVAMVCTYERYSFNSAFREGIFKGKRLRTLGRGLISLE